MRTSGTVRYAFTTRTTDLATNTTLGTATRHDYASINVDIPENTTRTFLSVRLCMCFRDHFTVANLITGIRMGIKLGAAATDDLDKTWTLTTSSREEFGFFTRDVTDYFNTNYGTGTTQTCVASIAVSTTSASNIAGNICAWLEIVYQYDDTGVTTRVKTIAIPIQSHGTNLTTTQQEIGTDAVGSPAPANQIPLLDTYLPEAGKTYKNVHIEIYSNDEASSTTDFVPEVQIDATAAVTRGTVGEALWAAGAGQPYRDVFNYDTATYSTASAHAFKMRCDATTTSRLSYLGAIMWVTYTYTTSGTTRQMNQALVPLTQAGDDTQGYSTYGDSAVATGPDETTFIAEVQVEEPGTITIAQSAAFFEIIQTSSYVGNPIIAAGAQADRTYTGTASTAGEHIIIHRGDHSSGWSLARGKNRLVITIRSSAATTRHTLQHAWAIVTWTSDVPATGPATGARFSHFVICGTQTNAVVQDIAAAGQRAPTLGAAWRLLGAMLEGHYATGQSLHQMGQLWAAGEYDSLNAFNWHPQISIGHAQMAWKFYTATYTKICNQHNLTTGKMDPTAARRVLGLAGQVSYTLDAARIISFHNITYTVAGTVTIDGVAAINGKIVQIFARDANNVTEYITSVAVAGGAGGFTVQVPDNGRTYFATYKDTTVLGRSDDGTPGTSTFNINIITVAGMTPRRVGSPFVRRLS